MSGPAFRSTAAFTTRHRATGPAIDRATFVLFGIGAQRFAVAVDSVERVLRRAPSTGTGTGVLDVTDALRYQNTTIRLVDLHAVLGDADESAADSRDRAPRILIFVVDGVFVAAAVDTVYEVATIDAAIVEPVRTDRERPDAGPERRWPPGARGHFLRQGHDVMVLDVSRVMRIVYASAVYASSVVDSPESAPSATSAAVRGHA